MCIEFLLLWYPDLSPREICISIARISLRRSSENYISPSGKSTLRGNSISFSKGLLTIRSLNSLNLSTCVHVLAKICKIWQFGIINFNSFLEHTWPRCYYNLLSLSKQSDWSLLHSLSFDHLFCYISEHQRILSLFFL